MNATNKHIVGFDILKYFLAIFIVSAHTELFKEIPNIKEPLEKITGMAIPCFFGISSYLFYKKIDSPTANIDILKHTIKRLITIFALWWLLMLPITYFRFFDVATLKETIYAILFTSTFNGYWFFKALIINSILLFYCRKERAIITLTVVSLIVYIFLSYNNLPLNISPYYSFYYHTAYFTIGALIAKYWDKYLFKLPSPILLMIIAVLYISALIPQTTPIARLLLPIFTISFFAKIKTAQNNEKYIRMRTVSILIYTTHFAIIWIYNILCNMYLDVSSTLYQTLQYSVTRFIIVLATALTISYTIIWLGKKPSFSFLKNLY